MLDKFIFIDYNIIMIDEARLTILTEGAKYDVSCSSSGSDRRNSGGIGNAHRSGICHSFTPDGRCISLLKILLSNDCIYSCKYCPNKAENDVPRATATPDEICELVINFYKRNYIEGLFLSSAVVKNPTYTMEQLLSVVKKLRTEYCFNGYIHLKGIPHADENLIYEAAKYADRMSYNIELPSEKSLKLLAPQKTKESLLTPMFDLHERKIYNCENKIKGRFLPAGQTTQMIVGATGDSDGKILRLTEQLYQNFALKRVYYSAYIPVVHDSLLPEKCTGLMREHRLYQADWLLRFYGFNVEEIISSDGNLSPDFDPKCAWALRHLDLFPVEINTAPYEMLLRIPGVGVKSAYRIMQARKYAKLTFNDLINMRVVTKRAKHFITCGGKFCGVDDELKMRRLLSASDEENSEKAKQLSLFSNAETALSALTGEV